jgi:hypothetical protein
MALPNAHKLPRFLRILHWVIIVNFLLNIVYGGLQVFVALAPEGSSGLPLFGAARTMDPNLMMARRMYAIEVWISVAGLCVYLALTEYLPRLLARD